MVTLVRNDIQFILNQIKIAEQHAAGTPITDLIPDPELPWGLRTVDGSYNNIVPGREQFGAADQPFPQLLESNFRIAEPNPFGPPNGPPTSYAQTGGIVVDSQPRLISNLIVDQTANNPAAVAAAATRDGFAFDHDNNPATPDLMMIPNVAPDVGLSAPFNSWMTLFGQFFDHGLDLVRKGDAGVIFMPLAPDDPLYVPGSPTNFLVLTRATNESVSAGADNVFGTSDDVHTHTNLTTSWVDQNQTYTSHASHQVFLREYRLDASGKPVSTGHLLEGANGGLATWAEVKAQAREMLGIDLGDADVGNVPLLATDQYGMFLRGPNGFAQLVTPNGLVEGNPAAPVSTAAAMRTGHSFLDDIAHNATPGAGLVADSDTVVGGTPVAGTYDNELLDVHYVTGDGRGNENIGLTAVHFVFHAEHNRLVEHIKSVVLATGDNAFIAEWLMPGSDLRDGVQAAEWNGERLFQAARFSTEMQYQHLVFEEFARKVQPLVNLFVFNNTTDVDPSIVAEFAHTVYRFGHSMLTETIDRMGPDGQRDDIGLIEAFLNPLEFTNGGTMTQEEATAAIVRGMSRQVGNEIDEFVTDAVRNNLLGLPLDLAAINLARGRDTGVPTLNEAREQFYAGTGSSFLKPYESWLDFALNIKNPASIINFIAAYGEHPLLLAETTAEGRRDAATLIVMGGAGAPADRFDFVKGTGAWAGVETGLNKVDFWIGGLAEKHMPFGGMLGSSFNFVFETQMEKLQDGDRLYYLSRLQGTNFLNQLEGQSFTKLIMRNTGMEGDGTHMHVDAFAAAKYILEVDQSRQVTDLGPDGQPLPGGNGDPVGADPVLEAIAPLVIRGDLDGDGDNDLLRYTGGDHVVLGGTAEADTIISGEGDDALWGDGGDDRLEGGAGIDQILGGAGDDIITDLGDNDIIKGEDGNDVISNGNGIDLVLAGAGNDAILVGNDVSEIFAGLGDDFVLGGDDGDGLLGNEGDDWIEGGRGFDVLSGDNSELFFNSAIIGHDVLMGQGGGDTDIDGESGDDIMVQDEAVTRNEGMFGFDWAIHKGDPLAADTDMQIPIFTTAPAEILRDRFDMVEGLSGWKFDDILRGDSRGGIAGAGDGNFDDHVLTAEGIARINGLQAVLGGGVTSFRDGNIILGGDGSDIIEGRGGNDIIDGDAWLNVRLSIRSRTNLNQEIGTVDSLAEIRSKLLSGEINPGQLRIAREILTADGSDDVDTAVFTEDRANYDIVANGNGTFTVIHSGGTGVDGTDTLRNVERAAFADQTVVLRPGNGLPEGQPAILGTVVEDGTLTAVVAFTDPEGIVPGSLTWSWEAEVQPGVWEKAGSGATFKPGDAQVGQVLRAVATYRDGDGALEKVSSAPTVAVANVNDAPVGGVAISDMTPTQGVALQVAPGTISDADGMTTSTLSYRWQTLVGTSWVNLPGATGASYTPLIANQVLRLVVTYTDDKGTVETLTSLPTARSGRNYTGDGGNNNPTLTGFDDLARGAGGNDSLNGQAGADTLRGEGGSDVLGGGAGNDLLEGGDNADTLNGLEGADTMNGGDGNDVANGGDGDDVANGGAGSDVLNGNAGNDLLSGGADADTLVGHIGNDTLEGDGGADFLDGQHGNDVLRGGDGGDRLNGAAGNDLLDGGTGADSLDGGTEADTLVGGADADTLLGGSGADLMDGGTEADRLTGGAGNDTLRGGLGADILAGGSEADMFHWASAAEGGDTVTDFSLVDDILAFSATGFGGGLQPGMALAARFAANAAGTATAAFGQFVYETDTGILAWDADGTGAGAAVVIATFTGNPALTASDLTIVA
ncbi:peroxidase family protein [Falsiroseomonas sp. CW058]|uniref:peroxidase family protein n=1 Tax=Falsiroseomonas sp. CW058 TaxID=3388664 RepID=UPI003D31F784